MLSIEEILPTNGELEYGIHRAPSSFHDEPSNEERLRYLTRIAYQLGAVNADELAAELLPTAAWKDGSLFFSGVSAQVALRMLAGEQPELFHANGAARLESTLEQANAEENAHMLTGPKLRKKFREKYGQARLDAIQAVTRERQRRERIDTARSNWLAAGESETLQRICAKGWPMLDSQVKLLGACLSNHALAAK